MARLTEAGTDALTDFAIKVLSAAMDGSFFDVNDRELVVVAAAEAGIFGIEHGARGGLVIEKLPDWLLEAAGQHTLTPEDAIE